MPAPLVTSQQQSMVQDTVANNAQQSLQSQTPIFTQAQLDAQGSVNDLLNQIMSGNVQQFGPPQEAFDALAANHEMYVAPQQAAVHGAGSPVMAASLDNAMVQLAGQYANIQMPNAINAFNSAAAYAFSPVGQDVTSSGQSTQAQTATRNDNALITDVGGVLGLGADLLAGLNIF